jgi:hypothetical protein
LHAAAVAAALDVLVVLGNKITKLPLLYIVFFLLVDIELTLFLFLTSNEVKKSTLEQNE